MRTTGLFGTISSLAISFALLLAGCAPSGGGGETAAGTRGFVPVIDGPAVTDRASTGGVSWPDVDGDGRPELYVTNGYDVSSSDPQPQPNRLYRLVAGGGLEAIEAGPLTTEAGFSSGSTWADFDNDGDLDAFVSNQRDQQNFLFRNDGSADEPLRFVRITAAPVGTDGGWSYSSSWVDADNDGRVDLYVSNGGLSHAGENFLYRNLGAGEFEKVLSGAIVTDSQASCAGVWADYDNDGDADLFVANHGFARGSTHENKLYRNLGGFEFEVLAEGPTAEDQDPSLAAAWGDYDNDGNLDLYVGNWFGLHNRLYRNLGDGSFERVTGQPAVTDGGSTYSVSWGDLDNDGDLDLLAVNWGAAHALYLNDGSGTFERSEDPAFTTVAAFGATGALADYDDDGDLDIYIGNWPGAPGPTERNQLIENRFARGNWLKVKLEATRSNRAAIGARVEVRTADGAGTKRQIRELTGATSFRSQDDLTQHFGLGAAGQADRVTVRWPGGKVESWRDVAANETLLLVEGEGDRDTAGEEAAP